MNIDLVGKRALVGGSTSGIGKAIALQLASCGAEVQLMSRNENKLIKLVGELDNSVGQQHGYLVTDFLDYERHKENISEFLAKHDIDILVNNTNGPLPGNVNQKKEGDYQRAFDLLFQTAVWATSHVLPYMRKQGYGRIINVSSSTVKEPQDNLILSNTMRTALVSWSKSLANEVGKDGVTVNSVLTGSFDTDRLNSLMQGQADKQGVSVEEIISKRIRTIPLKRLGKPEEYGFLIAFLASEYASFLTGTAIPLDGGAATPIF